MFLTCAWRGFGSQGGEWVDGTLKNSRNSSVEDRKSTIMDALNPSPNQNISAADREWLIDQANTFVFAGVDTTSTMLMYTFHKVLSSREIHSRLQDELRNANISIQEGYDWKAVRDLPYLTAVIKEGLRLSAVIPGRLPRTVPVGGIEYKGTFLPGGTVISSTIYSMHHNSTIFPDPDIFSPDRWLGENSVELERYNVAFSKGKRSCIGMKRETDMPDDKTLAGAVISAMMVCFAIVALGIVIAKYQGRCIDSSFELERYQERISVTPAPSPRSQTPPVPALETMGLIIELPRSQPFHSYHRGDFQVGAPQYGPGYPRPRRERDTLTDDSVDMEFPPPAYVAPPPYKP
ncbi:unnamed protein product [Penicillium pancosmium]